MFILYAASSAQVAPRSTNIRKVLLVNPVMMRHSILEAAHVRRYCDSHSDSCVVRHNLQPWLSQRELIHEMNHGDFVEIHSPPDPHGEDSRVSVCRTDPLFSEPGRGDSFVVSDTGSEGSNESDRVDEEFEEEPLENSTTAAECEDCRSFATWYIDHNRFRHCERPRIIRVCGRADSWRDVIFRTWADVMIRNLPFRITAVHAQPASLAFPFDTYRTDLMHVIVEQGIQMARVAVIVAQPAAMFHAPYEHLAAHSVTAMVCAQMVQCA